MEDKQQRMRSLVEELNLAAEAYYNGRGEQMTDYEWDAKFDLLKALEKETGIVLPDSPTHKVSEDDIAGKKEEHEFPTLSLRRNSSNGPRDDRYGSRGSLTGSPSWPPTTTAGSPRW